MGAALFPEFEKELPGIDAAFVGGKALSRAEPELQELATRIGVTPLMEFYGTDDAALAAEVLDGEEFEVGELKASPARWLRRARGCVPPAGCCGT